MITLKKLFIAACVVTVLPVAAFAASGSVPGSTAVTSTAFTWGSGVTFSPSSNVSWQYVGAAASFSCVTKHLNGDRTYATGSGTSNIYYNTTIPAGTILSDKGLAATFAGGTGWTAQ